MPDDILTAKWQPQRILDALIECDPDVDKDSRMAFGVSQEPGQPFVADTILETKAPTKRLLKKHYHRLGSYLHAPVDLKAPPLEKWKADLIATIDSLSEYTLGQALLNLCCLIDIECVCGRTTKRNRRAIEATGTMRCQNPECRAEWDVRLEGDETHATLQSESFVCRICQTENHLPASKIKDGLRVDCVECGKRLLVRAAFRLQPLDDEPTVDVPTTDGGMNDDEVLKVLTDTGNEILRRVKAAGPTGDVVTAIGALAGRIVQGGNTLGCLFRNATDFDWSWDGATILRTIYDAMLQSLYILHDDKERDQLARRFLDFRIVEQVKGIRLSDKGNTDMCRQLARSSKRATAEPEIMKEFQRVCNLYGYDEKKLPVNWYKGTLRDVAANAGYESEYEFLHKQLSGIVHSSYFALETNLRIEGFDLNHLYWRFSLRVLDRLANYAGVTLDGTEQQLVDISKANIFDRN